MPWFPFEHVVYHTQLSPDEVAQRLYDALGRQFTGNIQPGSFEIRRIINYRNSFQPIISGMIQPDYHGSIIRVRMRLHIIVIVFIALWCSIVLAAALASVSGLFTGGEPHTLIPWAMLIFMYVLTTAAFSFESIRTRKDLRTLFEAEIVPGK